MSTNATTPPAAVTVIGLGNMGLPMAACLLKAGFQVTGFDLSEAARAKFQAAGGRVAATASDAAKTADVVITLLPDGKIVRAVLEPLKKGFKPGAIIVDMVRPIPSALVSWATHSSRPVLSSSMRGSLGWSRREPATRPTTRPSACTSWAG
jgi:predicted dinucleotide-binding enzyme